MSPESCTLCGGQSDIPVCLQCYAKRLAVWQTICPSEFLKTDPSRIPDQAAFKKVMAWKYGTRGLSLHGVTGPGKSRSAWFLVGREYLAGRSVAVVNSSSNLIFLKGVQAIGDFCEKAIAADIRIFDDPFKVKMTDAYGAALFGIIDRCTESGKPIIATMNDTGESLITRLSAESAAAADRTEPMIRRLREFSDSIQFKKQKV